MHETFLRAVPEALRERARTWGIDRDLNDEVGAIWERIARGTLVGAGFGRDLFELRSDPAAVWVAAFGVVSGDDPVTMSLTTRAMFARFGEELVEPVERVVAYAEPRRRTWVGKALRGAASESGTPPGLRARLSALSEGLVPDSRARRLALGTVTALREGSTAGACVGLLELWKATRDPAILPLLEAFRTPSPYKALLDHVAAGDWDTADATFLDAQAEPDPRVARWLQPWAVAQRASGRPVPDAAEELLVRTLPASRALVDALGIEAADPPVTACDPALVTEIQHALSLHLDRRVEALWAEIHAHPADLAPRWVLADVYTERGDPRGPYMAASLNALGTGVRPRGEKTALARHESAWLGDFRLRAPRTWRGGVLAGGVVRGLRPAFGRREWRLVEELRFDGYAGIEDLTPEAFPSLRVLGMLPPRLLPWLAQSGLVDQLDRVFVGVVPVDDHVALVSTFPSPRKLVLSGVWVETVQAPAAWQSMQRASHQIPRGSLWPELLPPGT